MAALRMLDVFCCAGGTAVGYARAGFDVIGNDRVFKKDFPFPMIVMDALRLLTDTALVAPFDVIHASPPCQEHTQTKHLYQSQGRSAKEHGKDRIAQVRQALIATGKPYVIENVPSSPLLDPVQVCGSSFRLGVRRHRLFESNMDLIGSICDHDSQGQVVGVFGAPGDALPGGGRIARTVEEASGAMGITWMNRWADIKEAVPPVYTEFLGTQIRGALS